MNVTAPSIGFAGSLSASGKELEDIRRCVENLLQTPVGTCGMYRDFGIDTSFLDLPEPAAKAAYTAEVIEKIERYEPRVRVVSVQWTGDAEGRMEPKLVLELEV